MKSDWPIGVFDSGVGGLSVLRDIRKELPNEDLLYVADSVHAPYGDKSAEFIEARAVSIAQFLLEQPVKAMVVACNTATSAAVAALRAQFKVPIVAMEPAVKPAVERTRSKVVGVLATQRTVESENFLNLLERFGAGVEILAQPCPGLVEQIENGDFAGERTRALVARYVFPLLERGADILVLGCTHYPFLQPLIQSLAGPRVELIDPGEAVARELRRRLGHAGLLCGLDRRGAEWFWSSDRVENAQSLIAHLWGGKVEAMRLPERYREGALV